MSSEGVCERGDSFSTLAQTHGTHHLTHHGTLYRNVQWFRGGFVFKAHRLVYRKRADGWVVRECARRATASRVSSSSPPLSRIANNAVYLPKQEGSCKATWKREFKLP